MYYDITYSTFENAEMAVRVASQLIRGGFETKTAALGYINSHDYSDKYAGCCSNGEYPCITIEEHNDEGKCVGVTIVDEL